MHSWINKLRRPGTATAIELKQTETEHSKYKAET